MLLSDREILKCLRKKKIVIKPFHRERLGSNSYDVCLSPNFAVYREKSLDAKKENKIRKFKISEKGFVLRPGELYLATTQEYTETHDLVPFLEGKSSTGRLGIDIHATAGKGDVGFCGYWTMEISVTKPVKIYPGMPIGQLIYYKVKGKTLVPYGKKKSAKYLNKDSSPQESRMYKNFKKD